MTVLEHPHVYYVGNQPGKARDHFYGLREAKPDLVGFCLYDRMPDELQKRSELMEYAWQKREIENYIVSSKQVLIDWLHAKAEEQTKDPLFLMNWVSTMEKKIEEIEKARETLGQESPWSPDIKVTDDFLDRLFETVFDELEIPNLMQKTNYHVLVQYVPVDRIVLGSYRSAG